MTDTHAHLNDPQFDADLDVVIRRARDAGVVAILAVGYDVPTSERAVEIASAKEQIYATAGIHPNESSAASEADWARIQELLRSPKVVAVGETGLDYYRDRSPAQVQRRAFERQIRLAEELDLPIVVHSRNAVRECLDMLSDVGVPPKGGVMHSLEGGPDDAAAAIEMGLHVSANGMATWKNRGDLREMLKAAPLDRLLLETDAPYLSPTPVRGRRNEPAYVRHVAECVAEVYAPISPDELAARSTANAIRLFGLPGALVR